MFFVRFSRALLGVLAVPTALAGCSSSSETTYEAIDGPHQVGESCDHDSDTEADFCAAGLECMTDQRYRDSASSRCIDPATLSDYRCCSSDLQCACERTEWVCHTVTTYGDRCRCGGAPLLGEYVETACKKEWNEHCCISGNECVCGSNTCYPEEKEVDACDAVKPIEGCPSDATATKGC